MSSSGGVSVLFHSLPYSNRALLRGRYIVAAILAALPDQPHVSSSMGFVASVREPLHLTLASSLFSF